MGDFQIYIIICLSSSWCSINSNRETRIWTKTLQTRGPVVPEPPPQPTRLISSQSHRCDALIGQLFEGDCHVARCHLNSANCSCLRSSLQQLPAHPQRRVAAPGTGTFICCMCVVNTSCSYSWWSREHVSIHSPQHRRGAGSFSASGWWTSGPFT